MVEPPKPRLMTTGDWRKSCARCVQKRMVELPTKSTPSVPGGFSLSAVAKAVSEACQRVMAAR